MTAPPRRVSAAALATLLLFAAHANACSDDSTANDPSREADADANDRGDDDEPLPARAATPMPAIDARIDAALAELGVEADAVRDAASQPSTISTREKLARLSPRARAALRRHNVRLEQLAQRSKAGAR